MPSKKYPDPEVLLGQAPDPVPDSLVDAIRDESHLAMALVRELGLDQPIPVVSGLWVHVPMRIAPTLRA